MHSESNILKKYYQTKYIINKNTRFKVSVLYIFACTYVWVHLHVFAHAYVARS